MITSRVTNTCIDMKFLLKYMRITYTGFHGFHTSCTLQHDPNLKKKKVVPNQKLAKKKEKQEARRRLEPIVIPMDPDSVADPVLFESSRKRPSVSINTEEIEERVYLSKEWSRNCLATHRSELEKLQIRSRSRHDALRELKKVSVDLYHQATMVNQKLFPVTLTGPVDTPPCHNYIPPDLDDVLLKKAK